MTYTKSFSCVLTIFPDFYRDPYCNYLKEKINKWIAECFVSYNSFFKIKVQQHSAVFYEYDSEKDKRDINLNKLWSNQFGSYKIYISGAGILYKGISKSIAPPLNIVDNLIDKITFKYKEISDIEPPLIIAYGKNIGIPIKYCANNIDDWDNGFLEKDIYSANWIIDISCSRTNFDKTRILLEKLMKYNVNKNCEIDVDPYGLALRVNTSFLLKNNDKIKFFEILNELSNLVIDDDDIEINDFSMNFISQDNDDFSLEAYIFDEISGKFLVKNIHI